MREGPGRDLVENLGRAIAVLILLCLAVGLVGLLVRLLDWVAG